MGRFRDMRGNSSNVDNLDALEHSQFRSLALDKSAQISIIPIPVPTCEAFSSLHPQAVLQHQLGVPQFISCLTPSTWR